MSTGHGYIIHKDCGKGIIAYEAFGTDAESLGGAYELHTAIHLEDSEREGEYVSRHTLQTSIL